MKHKRIWSLILACVLVLSLGVPVSAAEPSAALGSVSGSDVVDPVTEELHDSMPAEDLKIGVVTDVIEPNIYTASQSEIDGAKTALQLNTTATGVLDTTKEEDWYSFKIDKKGYFQIKLNASRSANVEEIDYGWDLYIYKEDDLINSIKEYTGITSSCLTAQLPMESGTYYALVCARDTYSDYSAPTGCPYEITVIFKESTAWEVEGNDSNALCNTISVNMDYQGTLYHKKDVDWYRVDTPAAGTLQLILNGDDSNDTEEIDYGWDVIIYDKDLNEIKSYSGITSNTTAPVLAFEKGTFYIKVDANDSYSDYSAPTDCIYHLKMKYTKTSSWESEFNDTNSKADTISPNKNYSGIFHHAKDVDWYKVNITTQGYFQIQFTVPDTVDVEAIDSGWEFTVYDKNLKEIRSYYGITGNAITPEIPFEKGLFYVKVSAYDSYSDYSAPTDCVYNLKVKTTKTTSWESEYNDTNGKADTILPNKKYCGIFHHADDEDWYKVNITTQGYFQVQLGVASTIDMEDINNGWEITIYDKSLNLIKTYSDIKATTTTHVFPYAKGIYYVKVSPDDSYSESTAPVNCIYSLQVKAVKNSYWESEGNDKLSKADSIKLNKKYSGIFTSNKDEDWYKASVSSKGVLQLKFSRKSGTNVDDIGDGWDIYVYQGTVNNEVDAMIGIDLSDTVKFNVKKGNYYILVKPHDSYSDYTAPTNCTYQLQANFTKTPGATTITSATGGKKEIKLKWKKVSNANGYYIYRSTSKNSGYKKVATIKKGTTVTYVDKKLKAKKTYYYKIKAYTTTNGLKAEGGFSKVKSAKTKK